MKKMNYIFNLIAGAALLLSAYACSQEEIDAPASDKPAAKTEFRLGIADTKTSLGASEEGSRKVYWSTGDQVVISGITSDALTEVGEAVSSAVFTFDEAPTAPYEVVYPAGIYKNATTVTLPAYQTWKQGTFDDGMFPMAGYSATGLDATMDYLCATLKISILKDNGATPDEDNIRVVSFEGLGGERISGDFTIDYQAGTLTPVASPSDADKKVSVALNQSLSTDTALDIFIVVPAMNYASGFQITVQDSQGHIMTKTGYTTNGKELEAGKLYTLPEFSFIPSGEATGIEIWTAEDLIAFATAYNNREYDALGSGLIATVMDDLTFDTTTSAAFNATGGIGCKDAEGDNYFDGTFNGNNKNISGLAGTVPMFAYTVSSGTIKDLTLDSTCSFTFTHPNEAELDAGAVVGYHRGTLKNVTVKADVALAPVTGVVKVTVLGGLVGRVVVGNVTSCTYDGNISVPSGYSVNAQKTYIGGLVGRISNATGKVFSSFFNGTVSCEAQVTSTSNDDPYLIIGGIVGSNSGTIDQCETTDHPTVAGTHAGSAGTIVNKTTTAHYSVVGGIAGENLADASVNSCTNRAAVLGTLFKSTDAQGMYFISGGIVGDNRGSVSECTNNGTVLHRSDALYQYVGGVTGANVGSVSASTNSAAIEIAEAQKDGTSLGSARTDYLGGIIGYNKEGASLTDVQNSGLVTISCVASSQYGLTYLGGVIGRTEAAIDGGTGKNISNSGSVEQNYTAKNLSAEGYNIGGVVGSSSASIKNVSNSGAVLYSKSGGDYGTDRGSAFNVGGVVGVTTGSVENSLNSGNISLANSTKNNTSTGGYNLGGIVGKSEADVTGSINTGYVHHNHTGSVAATKVRVGGVVGNMAADGTISHCENNYSNGTAGEVYLQLNASTTYGHTGNYVGGILGYSTANVTISDCSNSGKVWGGNTQRVNGTTFFTGGIVAYLSGASSISGCNNSGMVYNNHNNNNDTKEGSAFNGGIAGFVIGTADDVISIRNCGNTSATMTSRRGHIGGIVAYAEYASLTSCTMNQNMDYASNSNLLAREAGGIVSWAVNTDITSCVFSGTTLRPTQLQTNKGAGIAGQMNGGTMDGCQSHATSIQSNASGSWVNTGGSLIGTASNTPTVKNCRYASTLNGAPAVMVASGSVTDGGGNVADL